MSPAAPGLVCQETCGTLSQKFGPVVNFGTMFKDTVSLVSLQIMHFLLLGCLPDSKYDVAEEKSV